VDGRYEWQKQRQHASSMHIDMKDTNEEEHGPGSATGLFLLRSSLDPSRPSTLRLSRWRMKL